MKYVLDSCVAVRWFLAELDSTKAIQLRDEFDQQIHDLLAPDVFPVEIAHALSRAERPGLIQPIDGSQPCPTCSTSCQRSVRSRRAGKSHSPAVVSRPPRRQQ
jgi:hypothetical protein